MLVECVELNGLCIICVWSVGWFSSFIGEEAENVSVYIYAPCGQWKIYHDWVMHIYRYICIYYSLYPSKI